MQWGGEMYNKQVNKPAKKPVMTKWEKCGEERVPEKDSEGRLRTFLEKGGQAHLMVIRANQLHKLEEQYFDSSNNLRT